MDAAWEGCCFFITEWYKLFNSFVVKNRINFFKFGYDKQTNRKKDRRLRMNFYKNRWKEQDRVIQPFIKLWCKVH